jgi:ABC-type uncharacterized transport system permease subunit
MLPTDITAMLRYDSFWESLFSRHSLGWLAGVCSVTAFVCVIYFAYRCFPLRGPYFGQLFILSILPFLICTAVALRHRYALGNWGQYRGLLPFLAHHEEVLFGLAVSGTALLIYSLFYGFSHNSRNA